MAIYKHRHSHTRPHYGILHPVHILIHIPDIAYFSSVYLYAYVYMVKNTMKKSKWEKIHI